MDAWTIIKNKKPSPMKEKDQFKMDFCSSYGHSMLLSFLVWISFLMCVVGGLSWFMCCNYFMFLIDHLGILKKKSKCPSNI